MVWDSESRVGLEKSDSASEPATLGFVVDRHRGGSAAGLALLPTRMMIDLEYPQLTVLNPVFEPHNVRHYNENRPSPGSVLVLCDVAWVATRHPVCNTSPRVWCLWLVVTL